MLPLTRAFTAASPKSLIQSAQSNVILVTLLLTSAIFLTSCGVTGASAFAPNGAKAMSARSSESGSVREGMSSSSNAAESSGSREIESSGHITVAATFPHATVGKTYNAVVSVSGGEAPYQFSIFWGALPAGMTINPTTGTISGTPVKSGTYQFGVLATDLPNTDRGDHRMTLVVDMPTVGIIVQVSPANATVVSGGTQQFTATVSGTNNVAVTWSATAGSLSNSGLFTAPIVKDVTAATVTATSVAQPSSSDSASVTISPQPPPPPPVPAITTTTIPDATAGISYLATLAATGGKLPYQWSIASGKLPSGIQLNNIGSISGLTTATGSFSFDAQVTDAAGQSDRRSFTLLVLGSGGGNCGPPTYNCSRTDLKTVQNPIPPKVGNLTGANTCITDPDFSNPVCRLTDANTDSLSPDTTFVVTSSGSADENHFNVDSSLIYIQNTGTLGYPLTFDPTTMHVARMYVGSGTYPNGMRITGGGFWSRQNPNLLFQISGTQLNQYDFTDRVTPPSSSLVYDFANSNCIGAGFTATWTTMGGGSSGDTAFGVGFSNNGSQGGVGAIYAAAYAPGQGCTVLNTKTGAVTGDWGTTGAVPNWTAITGTNGFTIHNVKISKDGNWLVVVPTSSSCNSCNVSAYFWQIGTLNVVEPSGNLSGHWTEGYTHWINNSGNPLGQENSRLFANAGNNSSIISGFPLGITTPFDTHQSWNNVDSNDSYPFLMTTYSSIAPYPAPWYNEILGVSPVTGAVYRFAHSFITTRSHRFTTQYGIGSVSQDGKFFLFSSDWMGTLGSESGASGCAIGTDCRGDVFVVELK
jgi:hypothetical protein